MRHFLDFLILISRYLIEAGCSSNRIELLVGILAKSWDFEVDSIALPTGIWIAVRDGDQRMMEMTRIREWSTNLDLLTRLSDLVESIHAHGISLAEAKARLRDVIAVPPPYGHLLTILAGGGASAALVFSYNGRPLEMALAFPAGALVQFLQSVIFVKEYRRYLADFLGAALVALYAQGCQALVNEVDLAMIVVGGIVLLVPGLSLVNAVHEIAQKNLVSGVAKMVDALMIAASLTSGVLFVLGLKFLA